MADSQDLLPFGPLVNRDLFSNHWLKTRLPMEPDWAQHKEAAGHILGLLGDLWKVQRDRVGQYGDEQGLEEAFIQPVLRSLGWIIKYQPHLKGRDPDYALFVDESSLEAALQESRTDPEFWNFATVVADAKAWHKSLITACISRVRKILALRLKINVVDAVRLNEYRRGLRRNARTATNHTPRKPRSILRLRR